MIILITGASHTGKTILAQKLLAKYGYPYMSIDHLKMGLIRSGNTDLTPMDDDKLTDYLWPIIREMIKTVIENDQNLIIEGCYIPADWRSGLEKDYLDRIKFVCLALSDDYIDSHYSDIMLHGSDLEKRMDDSDCTAEWLKASNKEFRDSFDDAFVIDGTYENAIDSLIGNL